MATIALGVGGSYTHLGDAWWPDTFTAMEEVSKTSTKAVYADEDGSKIVVAGTGLTAHGDVSAVSVIGADGKLILSAKGLDLGFDDLSSTITSDWIIGVLAKITAGNDTITGTDDAEELMVASNAGNDTIKGMGGDDFFRGGPGDNKMDGGKGFDTLSYHTDWWGDYKPEHGIRLDASAGTVFNPWSGDDTIKNFEKYQGTSFKDTMLGSSKGETLLGLGGADKLDGRGGVDTVDYGKDGNYGGNLGIKANLANHAIVDGFGKTDSVFNIENVLGSGFADKIIGDKGANLLDGRAGADILTGGAGADHFVFSTGYGKDVITDFRKGGDVIDISLWSAIDTFSELKSHAKDHGDDVWITVGGDTLIIDNLHKTDLAKGHFDFG